MSEQDKYAQSAIINVKESKGGIGDTGYSTWNFVGEESRSSYDIIAAPCLNNFDLSSQGCAVFLFFDTPIRHSRNGVSEEVNFVRVYPGASPFEKNIEDNGDNTESEMLFIESYKFDYDSEEVEHLFSYIVGFGEAHPTLLEEFVDKDYEHPKMKKIVTESQRQSAQDILQKVFPYINVNSADYILRDCEGCTGCNS